MAALRHISDEVIRGTFDQKQSFADVRHPNRKQMECQGRAICARISSRRLQAGVEMLGEFSAFFARCEPDHPSKLESRIGLARTPLFLAEGGVERHNQRAQNVIECGAFLGNDHD